MRNNLAALQHPTIKRKIRYALWLAKLQHKATGKRARQYIANRQGRLIMRLDFGADGVMVWGDLSRNITAMVGHAMGWQAQK